MLANQRDRDAHIAGSASYNMPSEVAWIKSLTLTYPDGSVTDPLRQVPLDTILEQRRATVAAGQSVVVPMYALAGQSRLELWPTPGAGQSLTFWYVYLPAKLTADADVPVIMEPYASKLLLYGALVEGARFKKDPLLADYEASYQFWLARFQVWLNRRETAGASQFRVRGNSRGLRFADASTDVPGYAS
jgi:hypothetical protein